MRRLALALICTASLAQQPSPERFASAVRAFEESDRQTPPPKQAILFSGFRDFAERVWAKLPGARLFYVSINRAPQQKPKWDQLDAANALIRDYCAHNPKLAYIDVNPALFDASGQPRADLYLPDGLHLKEPAYEEFARVWRQ